MATTAPHPVDLDDPLERLGRIDVPVVRPQEPPVRIRPVPAVRPEDAPVGARPVPALPAVDRAPGELDLARRIALADRLHALVVDASRMRPCDTSPQRAHRLQVLAARGRLADLEHVLRSGIPVYRRGERLVARLVSGDTIGVYCHGNPRALHDDADAACAALGVLTAFH